MEKMKKFTLRLNAEQSKRLEASARLAEKSKNEYVLECIEKNNLAPGKGYVKAADIIGNLTTITALANQLTLVDREPYEVQQEILSEMEKLYAKFN